MSFGPITFSLAYLPSKGGPLESEADYRLSRCTFTAKHGKDLGWKSQFTPEHIIEAADEEVELILTNLAHAAAGNDRLNRKK